MKKTILFVLTVLLSFTTAMAQNVAINSSGNSPDASAGLDVNFTDKGLLIPRVDIADLSSSSPISSPAVSLVVYNTNTTTGPGYFYWDGGKWVELFDSNNGRFWKLSGNSGTTEGTDFLGTTDNKRLDFRTNNAIRVTISSNGNVGIGTTSPANKLHVVGNIRHTGTMVSQGPNYHSTWMQFDEDQYGNSLILGAGGLTALGSGESASQVKNNVSPGVETLYLSSDNGINLVTHLQSGWSSRVEAMTIVSNGNVGIGTTSPSAQLHTTGTVRFANYSSGSDGAIVRTDASGNLAITNFTGNANQVLLGNGTFGTANTSATAWQLTGNSGTTEGTDFLGTTDNKRLDFRTNNAIRATISSNGNVGIGTTSPTRELDVNGNTRTWAVYGRYANDYMLKDHNNGNVTVNALGGNLYLGYRNSDNILFYTGSSGTGNEKMRLTTAGRLGIGTTNPQAQLQLADIYSAGGKNLLVGDDAFLTDIDVANMLGIYGNQNSDRAGIRLGSDGSYIFGDNGNLGIGTTSPSQKLDVSGNIKFSGALMPNNDPGTDGYLLMSQGPGLPPIWQAPDTVPMYGNNASSVSVNSLVYTTNTSDWEDIQGASITFTPKHSTFYIFASLCARLADNNSYAQLGQAMIGVRILVNGVVVADAASIITDFDDQTGVLTSGTVSFSGVKASASVGSSTTVKLQWKPYIFWAYNPWRVEINPTLTDAADHCVLTVFD